MSTRKNGKFVSTQPKKRKWLFTMHLLIFTHMYANMFDDIFHKSHTEIEINYADINKEWTHFEGTFSSQDFVQLVAGHWVQKYKQWVNICQALNHKCFFFRSNDGVRVCGWEGMVVRVLDH